MMLIGVFLVSSLELSEIHSMLFKSSATSRSERGSISVGVNVCILINRTHKNQIKSATQGFQNILTHMIPSIAHSPAIHRLFKALDQDNDNKLDFREVIPLFPLCTALIALDDMWT